MSQGDESRDDDELAMLYTLVNLGSVIRSLSKLKGSI